MTEISENHFEKLPAELLARIFNIYVDLPLGVLWPPHPGDEPTSEQLLEPIRRPHILQSVSRSWRDIAQSTPTLWYCNVAIAYPNTDISATIARIERSVERSGALLFSLYISCDCRPAGSVSLARGDPDPLGSLIALLHRYRHKWRHLQLDVSPEFLDSLTSPTTIIFPNLEALSLDSDVHISDSPSLVGKLHFPHLKTLRFVDETIDPRTLSSETGIDWASLTTIDCTCIYFSELRLLLSASTTLVHCRVTNAIVSPKFPPSHTPPLTLHIPHLETLEILESALPEDLPQFLESFHAPKLQKLRCISWSFNLASLCKTIVRLVTQSRCPLDAIHLVQPDDKPLLTDVSPVMEALWMEIPRSRVVYVTGLQLHHTPPAIWEDWDDLCGRCFMERVSSTHRCPPLVRFAPS